MHRLLQSVRSRSERERAKQQYNSCIMMYIKVATTPRIIKAQIRGYQYVEWPEQETETKSFEPWHVISNNLTF